MKKNYYSLLLLTLLFLNVSFAQTNQLTVFNNIVFYDGYAETTNLPTPAGVVRLDNSRYAKKLQTNDISNVLNTLSLSVTINALCDNYDRQGGVFLALVPTGEAITSVNKKTIEIGRFITPFMDKNVSPNAVSYTYDLNHLVGTFKNEAFLETYDIWVEFFLFGVPYAANVEIAGCAGRTDVFQGTLTFNSTNQANSNMNYIPKPLWSRLRMNKTPDTDFPGTAGRVVNFSNDEQLTNANIQLITSAHGARQGGEEYVRRDHFVYFDDNQILTYKPGGLSCEQFRQYNTQANGIYGPNPKPVSSWASWNNWCPGDKIPNRLISLGNITPGEHSFKISVPSGVFPNDNDEIIVSAFLYSNDNALLDDKKFEVIDYQIFPNPTTDKININVSVSEIESVTMFGIDGKKVFETNTAVFDISHLKNGIYMMKIQLKNGSKIEEKIIKK